MPLRRDRSESLRILVIEDDEDTRANLQDLLELDHYRVDAVGTLAMGLEAARAGMKDGSSWDVLILDRKMPDGNVEDWLPRLKRAASGAALIIITAYADIEGVIAAVHGGADDYLLKPFNPELLRKTLDRIIALREAERKAVQAQRLAVIGQMMTGLAHESRNALQRSLACLEMLEMEVGDRPEAIDLVKRVRRAQEQLHNLLEEVRNYAAPMNLERQSCSLRDVWREAWEQTALSRKGRDAELTEGIQEAVVCNVDRFRLGQVFRNIFENALAACRDPARISITCAATNENDPASAPASVRILIRDNGPGLTAEQRRRIFEPFFTTKPRGTGLGMAIAQRIVESHGGSISVEDVDAGAAILLALPRD
jgi:signal transduction histidine kinase